MLPDPPGFAVAASRQSQARCPATTDSAKSGLMTSAGSKKGPATRIFISVITVCPRLHYSSRRMSAPLLLALDQGNKAPGPCCLTAMASLWPGISNISNSTWWISPVTRSRTIIFGTVGPGSLWLEHASCVPVVAVSLTTQRASVVCLDNRNACPAVIWLDQRRTPDFPRLPWWYAAPVNLLGQGETLRQFQAKAECNWLAQDEPEIWQRTAHFLLLSGYLNYRLTGEIRDCTASQVGYIPFDYKGQRWAPPHDLKWKALQVTREQLPELIPPGETLGKVTAAASRHTGIPAGLPVIASGADKACEVLGSGAFTGHRNSATAPPPLTPATNAMWNRSPLCPLTVPRSRGVLPGDHRPARLLDGELVRGVCPTGSAAGARAGRQPGNPVRILPA